jgi:hypothetical protein
MPGHDSQPIDRQKQIELMMSVEERTAGYVRAWMKNPEVRAAVLSEPAPECPDAPLAPPKQRKIG